MKSGTSIGANVEESIGAQSPKDFLSKISIAYKEARETKYWIKLFLATGVVESQTGTKLLKEVDELVKILGKIKSTTKLKL